jgi:hypothetical protein
VAFQILTGEEKAEFPLKLTIRHRHLFLSSRRHKETEKWASWRYGYSFTFCKCQSIWLQRARALSSHPAAAVWWLWL